MLAKLWRPELLVTFAWLLREVMGCYNSNSSAGKASHQFDFHQNLSSIITNIKVQVAPTFPAPVDTSRIAPLGNGAELDSCSWKAHHADLMCKKLGFDVQTS